MPPEISPWRSRRHSHLCHLEAIARNLFIPGRAEVMDPPPLSFGSEARNLFIPGWAEVMVSPPLSFGSEARNLFIPGRAEVMDPPPLSFRSEARNLDVSFAGAYSEPCLRSLPSVEMTAGAGRDDSGGRSRRQRGQVETTGRAVETTAEAGRDDREGRSRWQGREQGEATGVQRVIVQEAHY